MGMTVDELITFCEEEEYNHRLSCKRYDDASGYTRSKDKNIRTADAIREETYGDFYKQVADTMRKYQKIVQIMERTVDDGTSMYDTLQEIEEVIEDGNVD